MGNLKQASENKFAPRALHLSPRQDRGVLRRRKPKTARYADFKNTKTIMLPVVLPRGSNKALECWMPDVVEKASHCAWQIHYHIVFPEKYRRGLLDEVIVKIIMLTAKEIEERYDIEFEQIGCDKDHVYLLCTAHPKIAPDQIVRVFKSITVRKLFKRKPDLKRDLLGGEFWTDGYYVATVGERANWGVVERYVKN